MAELIHIRWIDTDVPNEKVKVNYSVVEISDNEKRLLLQKARTDLDKRFPEYIELKDAHKFDLDLKTEKVVVEGIEEEPIKDEKPKAKSKKDFFVSPE